MEIPISQQLVQAASSLFLGAAAGFLYDFLRVVRHRARSKTVTAVTDFLFWLFTGLALFLLGLSLGQGRQRLFMDIISVLGGILYFCTLSRFTLLVCNWLADAFMFLFCCLTKPIVWAYLAYKKMRIFIKNLFHYQHKWYKIYANNRFLHKKKKPPENDSKGGAKHEAEKGRYYYEDRHIRSDCIRISDSYQSQSADRRGPHAADRQARAGNAKRNVSRRTPV
jgi:hypothetical protein